MASVMSTVMTIVMIRVASRLIDIAMHQNKSSEVYKVINKSPI